jgi:hypothetical protein
MIMHSRALILSVALFACAPPPDTTTGFPSSPTGEVSHYGLIILDTHFGEPEVSVFGQFLTHQGLGRESALHSILLPEQSWLTVKNEPGCKVILAPSAKESSNHWIDLLSVGTMEIRAPNMLLKVPARDYLPIVFSVSGVVYDAPNPPALLYEKEAQYVITASGEALGAMEGRIESPTEVRWNHHRLTNEGLDLNWSGADDVLVVLSPKSEETMSVVCNAQGDETRIAASILALLGDSMRVTIANVVRESLTVSGLDEAELIFVSRDTFELGMGPIGNE